MLLSIANKKSHTPFQMRQKLSTLDDLVGHWQPVPSAILATAGLFVIFVFAVWVKLTPLFSWLGLGLEDDSTTVTSLAFEVPIFVHALTDSNTVICRWFCRPMPFRCWNHDDRVI